MKRDNTPIGAFIFIAISLSTAVINVYCKTTVAVGSPALQYESQGFFTQGAANTFEIQSRIISIDAAYKHIRV